MKYKLLKKTIVYRILAYLIALAIGLLSPIPISLSIWFVSVSEGISLATYYIYEYFWERRVNKINYTNGLQLFGLPDVDKHGWYKVIEDLGNGKMVIEVE